MNDAWDEELTPEEIEALLDKAAAEIRKRKMTTPAILALEMHKPHAGLASHAMIAFTPFTVPFFGYDKVQEFTRLLKDRQNVERLIQRLESSVNTVNEDRSERTDG